MSCKQVSSSHYDFSKYMSRQRWASIWHQIDEVISSQPESVLEIGPGAGTLKSVLKAYGFNAKTADLDPDLNPDYVASAEQLPFEDGEYDVVCAFQMLEHLPYEVSLKAFREMCRVASNKIVVSLPDAFTLWPASLFLPKVGRVELLIPNPFSKNREHFFDGEHYWELNKRGYQLSKVVNDFCAAGAVNLERSYRVHDNPYHHFLIFS